MQFSDQFLFYRMCMLLQHLRACYIHIILLSFQD